MSVKQLRNILMTADTLGGVWTYAMALARGLQDLKVTVHLATMGNKLTEDQWQAVIRMPHVKVYESNFALEWMENPWQEVEEAGQWLLELEKEIQPDVIHLNGYVHGALPWHAPVLMVAHSCVLSWWQAVKREKIPGSWRTYAAKVQRGLQAADLLVGVSHHMLHTLQQLYGPFAHTQVIYNGLDIAPEQPADKEPVVLSLGRLWDEAKNIQALQQIAWQLEWPVYIAGDDQGKWQEAQPLNWLGRLNSEEVLRWLGKSAIYVMPARYEPFGLSVLEAALSGCALVLGDIGSLREIWGEAALYADPADPDALSEQISRLIKQPELYRQMADRATIRAATFSLEAMATQYTGAYRYLIKHYEHNLHTNYAHS